jgi:hypothetical protein
MIAIPRYTNHRSMRCLLSMTPINEFERPSVFITSCPEAEAEAEADDTTVIRGGKARLSSSSSTRLCSVAHHHLSLCPLERAPLPMQLLHCLRALAHHLVDHLL